jgi:hypothetical protein
VASLPVAGCRASFSASNSAISRTMALRTLSSRIDLANFRYRCVRSSIWPQRSHTKHSRLTPCYVALSLGLERATRQKDRQGVPEGLKERKTRPSAASHAETYRTGRDGQPRRFPSEASRWLRCAFRHRIDTFWGRNHRHLSSFISVVAPSPAVPAHGGAVRDRSASAIR